jgi:hypothetical protein
MAAVSKKNDDNQQKNQFLVYAVEILLVVFILLWLPKLVTG